MVKEKIRRLPPVMPKWTIFSCPPAKNQKTGPPRKTSNKPTRVGSVWNQTPELGKEFGSKLKPKYQNFVLEALGGGPTENRSPL